MKVTIGKVKCPECGHEFDYEYETLPFPITQEDIDSIIVDGSSSYGTGKSSIEKELVKKKFGAKYE